MAPHSRPAPAPSACPPEEDVACFLEGRASASTTRAILEHLDACSPCRVLLASSLRALDTLPSGGSGGHAPRTFRVGAVIGARYRIDRFISQGGMGEVYAAWDLELEEAVALKTLSCTGLDSNGLAARFRAEVQLARRVTHPNVCRILEFGVHRSRYREHDESVPFFTMELLSGETLAAYAAHKERLAEPEAIRIASRVLDGLEAIHAAGIVHRDLKPQNVFIEPSPGNEPRVIVMDFGLARLADAQASSASSSGGAPAGTPAYMAPEQALGGTPSTAWDVYAFGVLLFELVAGQLPFKGKTAAALAVARVGEAAPSLSSVVADVHPALAAVVARCLEREPARRFATTTDLRRALSDVRPETRRRLGRPLFLAAAVLVLMGIAGSAGSLRTPRTSPAGDHASEPQGSRIASPRAKPGDRSASVGPDHVPGAPPASDPRTTEASPRNGRDGLTRSQGRGTGTPRSSEPRPGRVEPSARVRPRLASASTRRASLIPPGDAQAPPANDAPLSPDDELVVPSFVGNNLTQPLVEP